MNTNPKATVVLCYGDSNTFGQRSDDVNRGRWPANIRWTGQLQELLGERYYIIEEGLSSRTTDLEHTKPGKNGRSYLVPCLQSHNPIDIVVLMLGTNDTKIMYDRSADDIALALDGLIDDIMHFGRTKDGETPKIILVSPIRINVEALNFDELYSKKYDQNSASVARNLGATVELLAHKLKCEFVDASLVAEPGEDGVHLSQESHSKLATSLATKITSSLPLASHSAMQ
jgi:lysophospholipase L1-like esterase